MKPIRNRHERRKQRTRRRLMDAARHVIARRGYDDTGVLDITEEADVSKGTFYLHFRDKEDLTRTLIVQGFEDLRARVEAIHTGESNPEQIKAALRTVFSYAAEKENRDLFRLMLGHEASAELNMLAVTYYADFVADFLAHSQAARTTDPTLLTLTAQFIAGAGVRLGMWWIEDDHGLSPDDMVEIMYRLLTEGVIGVLPGSAQPTAPESD